MVTMIHDVCCDVRLTSRNASVKLCKEQVSDYCLSSSDFSSAANTTVVIKAHAVHSSLRHYLYLYFTNQMVAVAQKTNNYTIKQMNKI